MLTVLLTTATQIVIVRALTKTEYGGFAYALALAAAGQTLLSLGQGRLLSRFLAKYDEERDYDRMFGSMVLAVATILITSAVSLTVLFLLSDILVQSAVQDPATVRVALILVFLGPLDALDQVFVSLFAAFSRPGAIFVRKYLFTPGLRLVVVVCLALTGSSVTFLAIGYVAAGVVGLVVSALVFVRVLRERDLLRLLRPRHVVLPYRAVFSFSFPLLTGELFLLSLTVGGVLILGLHHSAAEVASYRAVFNPSRLNNAVQQAFAPLFLPLAARLFTRTDLNGLRQSYWHTAGFVAVLTFPVFVLTGPLAPDLTVLLFGQRYVDSGLVLALLSVGYYFSVVLGFNAYTLQVTGCIRYLVGVNLGVTVLNVALNLALVPSYGAVGVAVANLSALVVQNLLNQWALRRSLDTGFVDRRLLPCYLVILAAASALWILQATVQPGLAVGLAGGAVAWIVVLLVSRNAIELADTFPALRRVPLARWLIR
ncbi:Membrane protein involved in the export of O-antigen and teichoic acid [Geodermatophilus telluris]|uniref:Membrane protein involved in the export of O-antigen and teichoic acid n=1 Tax=Geodermatophilus telluris TaxID=1190417 RepID=A0A1G6L5P0_9ACTN|nr:Membrane protein involved in the export of O-antigen and teichoic acid [Geodermatophilus telluris]